MIRVFFSLSTASDVSLAFQREKSGENNEIVLKFKQQKNCTNE